MPVDLKSSHTMCLVFLSIVFLSYGVRTIQESSEDLSDESSVEDDERPDLVDLSDDKGRPQQCIGCGRSGSSSNHSWFRRILERAYQPLCTSTIESERCNFQCESRRSCALSKRHMQIIFSDMKPFKMRRKKTISSSPFQWDPSRPRRKPRKTRLF